ncbi:MAG: hypothetical protein CXT77_04020 [uncultured DHVE6 group euryarchaeote]|jgi:uncharacterized membrane protein YbhN (UPF0104 family)|nr:MAG: hypothetical protein CXT77_04020 [uncultured DHVE6 group euryarchaeote]
MRRYERLITNNLKRLLFVIGLSILSVYLYTFDFELLNDVVFDGLWNNILSITALILLYFLVRAFRWHVLLKSIGISIPFKKLYVMNSVALGIGIYTPASLGEGIKLQLLKDSEGVKRRTTLQLFMLEKFFDFLVVILFALFASFVLKYISLKIFGAVVIFSILSFILFKSILMNRLQVLKNINYSSLGTAFILTIISWFIVVYNWVLLSNIINLNSGFIQMMLVNSLSALIIFISLVPGGLGFLELSNTYLISTVLTVDLSIGTLFALFARVYTLYALVIGLLHLLFESSK